MVLFTAYANIDFAVRGLKEGAADFVVKLWDNARLVQTLTEVCRKPTKGKRSEEKRPNASVMFWGESTAMKHLRTMVEKVSLTDAYADHADKFEAAYEGTLFLDEIGNLPYHLQLKLLTAIQSRSIVRVGSNTPIPVNIRLICATNSHLEQDGAASTFREDLLYRINTIHFEIPSLRERKEDAAWRFYLIYTQKTRKQTVLLDAIENNDPAIRFNEESTKAEERQANHTQNRIAHLLNNVKLDIAQREKFHELILNVVDTGVLVLNSKGAVHQKNNEALRLTGMDVLTHVSQLVCV